MRPNKENGKILQEFVELALNLQRLPNSIETYSKISERQVRKHFRPEFGDQRKSFQILTDLAVKKFPEIIPGPKKVLLLDIETAPMHAQVWQLWDVNIGVNQILKDGHLLSWAAKWLGTPESEMMYMGLKDARNVENDKQILKEMHDLLNQADIVITQNGKAFDAKVLNSRFAYYNMDPTKEYTHFDTKQMGKKYFKLPSYSLEYMCNFFDTSHKKLKHGKFAGMELWQQCLAGNPEAWKEMELYNKNDVMCLEDLYMIFHKWDKKAIKLIGNLK